MPDHPGQVLGLASVGAARRIRSRLGGMVYTCSPSGPRKEYDDVGKPCNSSTAVDPGHPGLAVMHAHPVHLTVACKPLQSNTFSVTGFQ